MKRNKLRKRLNYVIERLNDLGVNTSVSILERGTEPLKSFVDNEGYWVGEHYDTFDYFYCSFCLLDNNKIDDSINRDKKLIMINELLPDLVKNKKDNVNSKEILEKIFNKRDDNIIFLDRDDGDIGRENIYE